MKKILEEHRFYRTARHPDMLFEIRLALEEQGLDLRTTEIVAALMDYYGWTIQRAIIAVKEATSFATSSGKCSDA